MYPEIICFYMHLCISDLIVAVCIYFLIGGRLTTSSQREKLVCEKCLKARMLFSISFIYNSTDTKGAIPQRSHTDTLVKSVETQRFTGTIPVNRVKNPPNNPSEGWGKGGSGWEK